MLKSGELHHLSSRADRSSSASSQRTSVSLVLPLKSPAAISRRAPGGSVKLIRACENYFSVM